MADSGACEVVIAEFIYGPMLCGASGMKTMPGFEGEPHIVCDDHFKKGVYSIKPDPEDYDFYYHQGDDGYDSDDWDEEKYYDDVLAWEKIRDQK